MNNKLQKSGNSSLNKSGKGKLDLAKINIGSLNKSLGKLEIPRLFYQLVIFIIDASNSMHSETKNGISKAEEIDNGLKSVIKRLKESKNSSSFDICFISFSNEFKDVFSIKNVNEITANQCFNPTNFVESKGTNIIESLAYVKQIVENYNVENSSKNCQVLIQIMSDGKISNYQTALESINEIKNNQNTTVSCQYLRTPIVDGETWYSWDEETGKIDYNTPWTTSDIKKSEKRTIENFKKLATSEEFFLTSIDPEEIRKHMIKSISTVSKID